MVPLTLKPLATNYCNPSPSISMFFFSAIFYSACSKFVLGVYPIVALEFVTNGFKYLLCTPIYLWFWNVISSLDLSLDIQTHVAKCLVLIFGSFQIFPSSVKGNFILPFIKLGDYPSRNLVGFTFKKYPEYDHISPPPCYHPVSSCLHLSPTNYTFLTDCLQSTLNTVARPFQKTNQAMSLFCSKPDGFSNLE